MATKSTIIIIPDVHGRTFWKEAVRALPSAHVVFLGDYLDPYRPSIFDYIPTLEKEDLSPEAVIENFKAILELKKSAPDRVTLLLGNHDCEYMYGKNVCDCRCDNANYDYIQGLFRDNRGLFQLAAESYRGGKHFVFVHAGIGIEWMNRHVKGWNTGNMVEKLNQLNSAALEAEFPEQTAFAEALSETDHWRGGDAEYASPVWIDAIALNEGYQLCDVIQIVGHTAVWFRKEPVIKRNVIYTDCQKPLLLGERGCLRHLDGKKCRKRGIDPFCPPAAKSDMGSPFGVDWFRRPFCRQCGSHHVYIRAGMYIDRWRCSDCGNNAFM